MSMNSAFSAPRRKSKKKGMSLSMSTKKSKSGGGWFGSLFSSKKKSSSSKEIVTDSCDFNDFNQYRTLSAAPNYTALESCSAPRLMTNLCTDSAMATDSFKDDFLMADSML